MKTEMYLPHGGGHQTPRRIVIHAMAEYIEADLQTARQYKVKPGRYHAYHWLAIARLSAHSLITPAGANILARPSDRTAWHAKAYNTDSLGIEFLVTGAHNYETFLEAIKTDYLSQAQYQAGVDQVREWLHLYPIEQVDTHSDLDPVRKKDPGAGFPMDSFKLDVYKEISP